MKLISALTSSSFLCSVSRFALHRWIFVMVRPCFVASACSYCAATSVFFVVGGSQSWKEESEEKGATRHVERLRHVRPVSDTGIQRGKPPARSTRREKSTFPYRGPFRASPSQSQAFNMIDQNRDGFIDKEDLKDMMASLGKSVAA